MLRVPIGLRKEGIVEAVALSPDGQFAAVGAGQIYIFDTASGSLTHRLGLRAGQLSFSPDGKYLVAANINNLRLWNTADWSLTDEAVQGYIAAFDARDRLYTVSHRWASSPL